MKRNTLASLRRVIPERGERQRERSKQDRALGYVDDDAGFVNLYFYFSAAAERFEPGSFDVDVTVLKADHIWPVQPDDYYWRPHITGALKWLSVPGDHHSMFYPEHAPALGLAVRDVLRDVEQRSS